MEDRRNELESLKAREAVYAKLRKRGVWFFVETYNDVSVIEYACSRASHWAYIYHDRDTFSMLDNPDRVGELKVPHYHVLLHYDIARSGLSVLKDFIGEENTMVEVCSHPLSSYEYLTHDNHPDKFQYSKDLVICHDRNYWTRFLPRARDRPSTNDLEVDFIADLLGEKEPDLVYMARKYGRDFIKNHRAYLDFRDAVKYQNKFIMFKNGE